MSVGDDGNIQQNILDVNRTWQDGLVPNETRARTVKKEEKKRKEIIYKETRSKKVNIKMIQQLSINQTKQKKNWCLIVIEQSR